MNPAVFLDRDGVLIRAVHRNGRPTAAASMDEVEILPGVREALEALRQAGFRLIVVTNQPDVAAGTVRREVVEAIHEYLRRTCPLDDIKVCYHLDRDGCGCRKPKPGMLVEAARQWALDIGGSVMVGDRWRDIAAGRAAGCRTVLIGDGYGEPGLPAPDIAAGSLLEATASIMRGAAARSVPGPVR